MTRFFYTYFLPALFIVAASPKVIQAFWQGSLGIDAEIYINAARAWLAGTDPWEAFAINEFSERVYHFSALPPMVVLATPFTLVPDGVGIAAVIALAATASVFAVRALHLRWYWLLFPPLVEGVLSGNPSLPVLFLLLTRGAFVAPLLKIYAFAPLFGERAWRQIALSMSVVAGTVILFPSLWVTYLTDLPMRSARLVEQAGGGHSANTPLMIAGVLIALLVIVRADQRAAGWLVVPALWPASQFHWSTLAMPVMTPMMAILLAIPAKGMPAVAVMAYAVALRWDLVTGAVGRLRSSRTRRKAD